MTSFVSRGRCAQFVVGRPTSIARGFPELSPLAPVNARLETSGAQDKVGQPEREARMPNKENVSKFLSTGIYPNGKLVVSSNIKLGATVEARAADFADRVLRANDFNVQLSSSSFRVTYGDSILSNPRDPLTRIRLGLVNVATIVPLTFLLTTFGLLPFSRKLLDFSLNNFPLVAVQSAIFLAIIIAGILLYRMRCRSQKLYGVTECLVGILMAGYYVNHLKPEDPTQTFTLLGAMYIIVRGMDNIQKSLKGAAFETTWNKMFFGRHPATS